MGEINIFVKFIVDYTGVKGIHALEIGRIFRFLRAEFLEFYSFINFGLFTNCFIFPGWTFIVGD